MRASLITAMAALLLTSCQSYPSGAGRPSPTGYWSHGYQIVGGGARDSAQVKQMLRTIAAKTNLAKRSPSPDNFSPVPFALYGDSRVQLLASHHKDYVQVEVTRYDFSGASAFARIDLLVRSTLSTKFGNRLYVDSEPDYSHPIITY
jgi:hypothetical protein